jgi:AcrR family transcriptional regulator
VTPRRLKPQQRREQLLDTGAALFAEKPYDDVMIQDIAALAGVSRALMYHYFPTKRDLYVAIFERASSRFLARASPDPELSLSEQLATALEAHIQSLVDHPFEAATITRSPSWDCAAVRAIVAEERDTLGQRLVEQLVEQGIARSAGEIAVEGWLAFVRAACTRWIDLQNISRADLTEMCLRAFDCALDIPTPTSRLRSRISGVMQFPAINLLIGKSKAAASAPIPNAAVGHDRARPTAISTARSALTSRKGSWPGS